MFNRTKYCLNFSEIGKKDIPVAGGKGANLGEMYNAGFPVPPGFVISSKAYFDFIDKTSLREKIKTETRALDISNSLNLERAATNIRTAMLAAKMPVDIENQIKDFYIKLSGNKDRFVAVRSSATAEDLPDASFAGQQESYLNVLGWRDVVTKVQHCWASLFSARAIFYRQEKGYDHFKVGIAVPIQAMVESEVSGIMFSVNPITNNKSQISIEAGYGLGQTIVSGEVTPDQYLISKFDFKIVEKNLSKQTWKLTRRGKVPVLKINAQKQKLPDDLIIKLAKIGQMIEDHYKFPQDMEWGMEADRLYIVQSRPITTLTSSNEEEFSIKQGSSPALLEGLGASPGAASGKVRILKSVKEIGKIRVGEVLVAQMTNPDFVPAMKKACAIVTDQGGRTSHAAIVSRELGIPCVVGTSLATKILKNGEIISVDGTLGLIYEGSLEGQKLERINEFVKYKDVKTATKLYVNLGEPNLAQDIAAKNVDGVGLFRAEFLMAQIGTHPKVFVKEKKQLEFIQKMAGGMEEIAGAFYPRPVIYRASDFRTNEFRNLRGGIDFESLEANPMIGFRGVSRYVEQKDVFAMELEALKIVRNKKGFKNLHLMLPFVRTVEELVDCKRIISDSDLRRGPNFHLWIMVEVPSTAIILDKFIEAGIDGVSIGSNDLTQLILGLDRDNERVSHLYDERNEAVMWAIERVVSICQKHKITSSICGQAPSDYPKMVKRLVELGVTSVSVSPDALDRTRGIIYKAEEELVSHS
ncbi:phosphoenolpyruvate synthase [candidate division WWE3 bacterium CG08_land_8_20_14_0_20_40_13]|uniref:Phosphoenolpyruvate synthase n=1 Tax=candidate division WWE3 bacterium CG08_land_8_20_14_0_20_40_13 TaxID=1975084 RepID=A0A2H0XDW5_UNCKA|nr:MAG: phosphoenolpyruvate synthase [candidate division WWE3 bacterium CG08_land_8_20_14_0_20_40_13]